MLEGALSFLGNQSFFFLRTLALYRQIERSGHLECFFWHSVTRP